MAAISLTRRQCGFFLLGALLVVNVCEAAPAAAAAATAGSVKKASPENTALTTIPSTAKPGEQPTSHHKNGTVANKNETVSNATATSNSTHVNGTQGGANTTVPNAQAETTTQGGVKTDEVPTYFFSDWITWKDNYLMSIMIPVACGVGAAVLILCSLACIGCCRRRCRSRRGRRNLPKKIDPKTFRKMKAADRIKLLAASSDEEF